MREKISVISLIAYDWEYLLNSIPTYYEYVDEIVLGIDKNNKTWTGNFIEIPEEVFNRLDTIDGDSKISIVADDFCKTDNPIQNDTSERNTLRENCSNRWIFSFDADEELINAEDFFVRWFPLVQDHDVALNFTWFLAYKEFDKDILYIGDETGTKIFSKDVQEFGVNKNYQFNYCRWSNCRKKILTPLCIKHNSFCRPDEEINLKINNFGHSKESLIDPFYNTRNQITLDNYSQLRNFKTSGFGEQWPTLIRLPKNKEYEILKNMVQHVY